MDSKGFINREVWVGFFETTRKNQGEGESTLRGIWVADKYIYENSRSDH